SVCQLMGGFSVPFCVNTLRHVVYHWCGKILEKGEVQVSEKERQSQLESTFRDVATVVADKCVNPETKRPYTVGVVERAMRDAHVSLKPHKNTKQQALEVIRILQETIPLQRASMRLKVTLPAREARHVRDKILPHLTVQHEEWDSDQLCIECLMDPGCYRVVEEAVRQETKGRGTLELLSIKEVADEEHIQ
ncbi:Ribosome maturation protein SBDS, partial [Geodia barretti]